MLKNSEPEPVFNILVSHTTDDLIFEWDPQMPLDVDSGIELPQLELTHNFTGDCTTAYSTGKVETLIYNRSERVHTLYTNTDMPFLDSFTNTDNVCLISNQYRSAS